MLLKSHHKLKGLMTPISEAFGRRGLHQKPKGRFVDWYRDLWSPSASTSGPAPPHGHIVQLGDPALRARALPVDPADVGTDFVQGLVKHMVALLGRYDALGLSAPQLGLPARISVVQMTRAQIKAWGQEKATALGMEEVPLKVLINPTLKVLDHKQILAREGCCSMHGFSALVPRAARVEVTALNERGEEVRWVGENWSARLAQHELDHLDGKIFIDRMQPETLEFNYWKVVNARKGDFKLGYSGITGVKHVLFPFKKYYR